MSTVLVVGLGEVGVRTARQLLDTPGVDRVLVAARRHDHAEHTARALQDGAEPVVIDRERSLPEAVDAVACAVDDDGTDAVVDAAVHAGAAVAVATDHIARTRAVAGDHSWAPAVPVVMGCGLAPGLADVLTRHAAGALDEVDEVHVARWGVAGDACAQSTRQVLREPAAEWRNGEMVQERGRGDELIWFPDPVGARECALVGVGVEALVAAVPGVTRATMRLGMPSVRRLRVLGHNDPGEGFGAVRAEAWGWQGKARRTVVYGVIERTAVAAGTVLGVTAAWLAGALPALGAPPAPGIHSLGPLVDPVPFLVELANRGVKAAAFEGVPVG
jgi:hypothetical protein